MSGISAILGDATTALVLRVLDAGAMRQAVHAANIANASVPDYQPLRVDFDALVDAVPRVVPDATATPAPVDREVALMMENSLHYQALLNALGRESSMLRLAIREGRD